MILGGCNNNSPEIVPTDVTFSRNLVSRPVSWEDEGWSVKNLFEVKLGRKISVEDNLFENNWTDAQSGFAILLMAVPNGLGLDGDPFALVQDITFKGNVVRNSPHGINISSVDRLRVENNLFVGVTGRLFQLLNRMQDVDFLFNTALDTENTTFLSSMPDGAYVKGLVVRGNILNLGTYGIKGSGLASGNRTIAAHYPEAKIDSNLFIGGSPTIYPENNYFVAKVEDLQLSGYALPSSSPYTGIVDGRDPGFSLFAPPPPPPLPPPTITCSREVPNVTLVPPVQLDQKKVAFTITVANTDSATCGLSRFDVALSVIRPASMQLDVTHYTLALDAGASGSKTVVSKTRHPSRSAKIAALATRQEPPLQ
jgi:hypothetical protein